MPESAPGSYQVHNQVPSNIIKVVFMFPQPPPFHLLCSLQMEMSSLSDFFFVIDYKVTEVETIKYCSLEHLFSSKKLVAFFLVPASP